MGVGVGVGVVFFGVGWMGFFARGDFWVLSFLGLLARNRERMLTRIRYKQDKIKID